MEQTNVKKFDFVDWFNTLVRQAMAYEEANGNLDIPVGYVCEDGYALWDNYDSLRTMLTRGQTFEKANAYLMREVRSLRRSIRRAKGK